MNEVTAGQRDVFAMTRLGLDRFATFVETDAPAEFTALDNKALLESAFVEALAARATGELGKFSICATSEHDEAVVVDYARELIADYGRAWTLADQVDAAEKRAAVAEENRAAEMAAVRVAWAIEYAAELGQGVTELDKVAA